jgi:hypothetical protein
LTMVGALQSLSLLTPQPSSTEVILGGLPRSWQGLQGRSLQAFIQVEVRWSSPLSFLIFDQRFASLIFKELPDSTRLVLHWLQATFAPRGTPLLGTPPEGVALTFASPSETHWSECGPISSLHDPFGPCSDSTELLS